MAVLGDYITIKHGYAFKGDFITSEDNGVVLVTPGNFEIGGGFKEKKCKFFSSVYPVEYILKPDDLIVTMTDLSKAGDTLGYSAKVPFSKRIYLHNQRIGLVKICNNKVDKDYLYWFMRTPSYQKRIVATASGTTVKHTSPSRICEIEVDFPPLETQQKISSVLKSLDDKIELNNAINKNLEEQAQAIITHYNEMILQTAELSSLMTFDNGFAFQSHTYLSKGRFKIITIKNVQDGIIDSQGSVCIDELPPRMKDNCILHIGDVLLSLTGNVGRVGIVYETNLLLNQRVAKFVPKDINLMPFLYFVMRQPTMKSRMETIAKGTAQPNLSPIETLNLLIPFEKESAFEVSSTLAPMFKRVINNNQESMRLVNIRDTLLPRLMSGELDVSAVNI